MVLLLERIEDYIHEERRAYSMEEVDNSSRTGIPASLDVLWIGSNKQQTKVVLESLQC